MIDVENINSANNSPKGIVDLRQELTKQVKGMIEEHAQRDDKQKIIQAHAGRAVNKKDFTVNLNQDPLIYQRFLNHPEFAFPNTFV